ncbi:MAG: carbamoyl phosphate synthase small subunit [Desulfobulbus propionicus]|nr:MAG: carbamoyl phosphate synthase small subunit [Desulfobulbus propionicus]
MKAFIGLEDGTVLEGRSFTGEGEAVGEIVFNTSMSGYQEVLSDPSYTGQLVTMTYPLIGSYGVNAEDMESTALFPGAFVVREYQQFPSNYRAQGNLADLLRRHSILGVEGVDTRMLTRKIRTLGAMKAVITTQDFDAASLVARARDWTGLVGQDMVSRVTGKQICVWRNGRLVAANGFTDDTASFRVAAYDFGIKFNQLRLMSRRGCEVLVVPATTPATVVLELNPDGIFLSNGPGDPAGVAGVVDNIRSLLGKKPIFGICLGHQMLGLAYGGSTYKLKFGHRGGNQPVKDLTTGRVEITAQNHGFCVDPHSLPPEIEVTHINLNDGSLAGMRHRELPVFSVQYHPEHGPGPHDAEYLFDRFIALMEKTA